MILSLFIVLTELSVGAVSVLVFLDWRNEVKRGFLVSYALIYLFLVGLTYLFQQNFVTTELLQTFSLVDLAWIGYLGPLFLAFLILLAVYSFFVLIDKRAGIDGKEEAAKLRAEGKPLPGRIRRGLRLISGVFTVLAALGMLLVLAMIFRPLVGDSPLAQTFAVIGFFAGAFAVGGVLTAMWLGHWYLVTPALSEKPLLFSTTVVLGALVLQILLSIFSGSLFPASVATANTAGVPLGVDALGWLRLLIGFAMPLVLGGLSWKLVRDRSFQSGTGMLYLVVVCILAGEIIARGFFVGGLL
jgi:hypothetical protein